MKLKHALEAAYKASWYVWSITIDNQNSPIRSIHMIHHVWNDWDARGEIHILDFLYCGPESNPYQHPQMELFQEKPDFSKLPDLDLEEDGWELNAWDLKRLSDSKDRLETLISIFTGRNTHEHE